MMTEEEKKQTYVAEASILAGGVPPFGDYGAFYMPQGDLGSAFGLTPEKLIVPKEYHTVLRMVYDFYQRGGAVATVINRLAEFTITDIRNGQRDTTDEENAYYNAILDSQPSRLMRFLRTVALEYFLSGLLLPRIDWTPKKGKEIHPDLKPEKDYIMPIFDTYSPMLIEIVWASWGQKRYYLKVPSSDIRLIRSSGSKVKEQQLKYDIWKQYFPTFFSEIRNGANRVEIKDSDPILRKEISISAYPTPYLFPVLEPLVYKQQLRRMDFAVASRVINAILLVQEGDKDFPLTEENKGNLDKLKEQITARSGNPAMLERLFILFSNHTTKLTWITPDVDAMLNQEKYKQVNDEIQEGLGFTRVLLTGDSRQAQASEVSTYSIQPQMEELRAMLLEWVKSQIYWEAKKLNGFKNMPSPSFKPIRLQDFVKTASIFAQAFKEGNISRTTRAESIGTDFETETELMKDEKTLMAGLPPYQPTPYSPLPPMMNAAGRPIGSTNVPINNRNAGVKPPNQTPTSKIAASMNENGYIVDENFVGVLMEDEEVLDLMNKVAEDLGIKIGAEDIIDKG